MISQNSSFVKNFFLQKKLIAHRYSDSTIIKRAYLAAYPRTAFVYYQSIAEK